MPHVNLRRSVVLLAVLLAGCSIDPSQRKAAYFASGEQYAKKGKYQEAIIQFRNAVEIDPRFAAAHYRLALAYLKLSEPEQAYPELSRTVELDPKNSAAQLERAALLIAGAQYDEAQAAAEAVLRTDPRNSRAHAILGSRQAAAQAWPPAIREFQAAVELDPTRVENYAGLASVYLFVNRPADAEATLRKAADLNSRSMEAHLNLGRFYYAQHRLSDAGRAAHAAAEADPRAVLPLLLLAKIDLDSGRQTEADRACAEVRLRAAQDPDAYAALSAFYEATGQTDQAAAALQALAAVRPKSLPVKAHWTDLLIDLDRIDEAARVNRELLGMAPSDPRVLTGEGRILLARGKYTEAQQTFEKALRSDPKSGRTHYFLGVAQNAQGFGSLARASFARALALSPGITEALTALIDLDLRSGDAESALRLANQAIQNNPDSPAAYVSAANALLAKGKTVEAEARLHSALEHNSTFLPALGALVDLEAGQGRAPESVRRLTALISQNPRNARLHLLLAAAYFKDNDLEHSRASVESALAIDPHTPDAHGLLAEISRARGAWEQAIASYRAAIEENPKKPENWMALSAVYDKQARWQEAKEAAERAYSLDPASPFIANNLAYLYLEHGGDLERALTLAQKAKEKLPDSPIASDTLGWTYYKLRSTEAAIAQLSESVRRAPANPTYRYHLAMAYIAAARFGDASRSLREALSTKDDFPYAADARAALRQIASAGY